MKSTFCLFLSLTAFVALGSPRTLAGQNQTDAPKPKPISITLELSPRALDMDVLRKNNMGFMPSGEALVEEKPAGIVREPVYKGKPKYGAFVLGNGPHNITYFAVDEVKGEKGHIYIDKNQNGDLTDDGPGEWDKSTESDGVLNYETTVALHASWGSPVKEDEGGSYTIFLYKQHGSSRIGYTKLTARAGKLELGGKTYPVLLAENNSDAIFTVAKRGDRTRRPVQLMIDLDGDGTFKGVQTTTSDGRKMFAREQFTIDQPFQIAGAWWDAIPSISGGELIFVPTAAPGLTAPQAPVEVVERKLVASGVVAPDFTAQDPAGKPVHLSDFKGKVVLLDFWATWCGPCQVSMPGLEKIYGQVKSQGVVVLSLNVFDEKDPFDAWIAKNSGTKYSFTFAFDPAGRDNKKSIAAAKYGVSGIPTMFVIDRDGKVANAIVGSGNEKNLVTALDKLGVHADAP